MGQREAGVLLDCLAKILNSAVQRLRIPFVPVVPALEIQLIRVAIFRYALGESPLFIAGETNAQLGSDLFGNLFLNRLHILLLAVITSKPQAFVVPGID